MLNYSIRADVRVFPAFFVQSERDLERKTLRATALHLRARHAKERSTLLRCEESQVNCPEHWLHLPPNHCKRRSPMENTATAPADRVLSYFDDDNTDPAIRALRTPHLRDVRKRQSWDSWTRGG